MPGLIATVGHEMRKRMKPQFSTAVSGMAWPGLVAGGRGEASFATGAMSSLGGGKRAQLSLSADVTYAF